jgi:hypothetical protein
MFARYGGVDGFCNVFYAHIQAAPPGSWAAVKPLNAIVKLLQVADAQQQPSDLFQLTKEELEQEMERCCAKLLEKAFEKVLEDEEALGELCDSEDLAEEI